MVAFGGSGGGGPASGGGGGDVCRCSDARKRLPQHQRKCSLPSSWAHPRLPGCGASGQAQFCVKRHLPRLSKALGEPEALEAAGAERVLAFCPAPAGKNKKTDVAIMKMSISDK